MFNFVAGSDRNGRLGDDHGRLGDRVSDFFRRRIDIAQVGMAIASARGGSHGDKNRITILDRSGEIGGKGQALGLDISFDEIGEAGFEDRHDILIEIRDFFIVLVDANHFMAEICEASA